MKKKLTLVTFKSLVI